jgi:hypothetical protein
MEEEKQNRITRSNKGSKPEKKNTTKGGKARAKEATREIEV